MQKKNNGSWSYKLVVLDIQAIIKVLDVMRDVICEMRKGEKLDDEECKCSA